MDVKSIGVIGGGTLGKAVARGFLEHAEVRVFDNIKERATHSIEESATCDVVFICLPTPPKPNGVCDTTAIDDFLDDADRNGWWNSGRCYVLRSTVPIGFTEATSERHKLPLLHSPEFLTARCALTDFQIPARNIIGVPLGLLLYCAGCGKKNRPANFCYNCGGKLKSSEEDISNEQVRSTAIAGLRELYMTRFPGVPIHVMASNESELVKLACNAFFATKVTFFNVIQKTAALHDCDWKTVRAGILSDGRIAHAHTMVPGQSGEFGYGGACLKKDTSNLRTAAPVAFQNFLLAVESTNAIIRGESAPQLVSDDDQDDRHGVAQAIIDKANIKLKAQVIRMAYIAAKALMDGVRPSLASGLVRIIEEAGFEFEPPFGSHVRDQIEAALQEANRAMPIRR